MENKREDVEKQEEEIRIGMNCCNPTQPHKSRSTGFDRSYKAQLRDGCTRKEGIGEWEIKIGRKRKMQNKK